MKQPLIFRKLYLNALVFSGLIPVLLLTAGCSRNSDDKPDMVLEEEKMVEVMVDVHIAEAILTRKRGQGEDVKELTDTYYLEVFEKYDISKEIFDTSFSYYQRNLDQMDRIYENVITELNKMQREAELKQRQDHEGNQEKESKNDKNDDEKPAVRMKLKKDIRK